MGPSVHSFCSCCGARQKLPVRSNKDLQHFPTCDVSAVSCQVLYRPRASRTSLGRTPLGFRRAPNFVSPVHHGNGQSFAKRCCITQQHPRIQQCCTWDTAVTHSSTSRAGHSSTSRSRCCTLPGNHEAFRRQFVMSHIRQSRVLFFCATKY